MSLWDSLTRITGGNGGERWTFTHPLSVSSFTCSALLTFPLTPLWFAPPTISLSCFLSRLPLHSARSNQNTKMGVEYISDNVRQPPEISPPAWVSISAGFSGGGEGGPPYWGSTYTFTALFYSAKKNVCCLLNTRHVLVNRCQRGANSLSFCGNCFILFPAGKAEIPTG